MSEFFGVVSWPLGIFAQNTNEFHSLNRWRCQRPKNATVY